MRRSRATSSERSYRITLTAALGLVSVVVALLTLQNVTNVHSNITRQVLLENHAMLAPPNDNSIMRQTSLSDLTITETRDVECPNGLVFIQDRILPTHHIQPFLT